MKNCLLHFKEGMIFHLNHFRMFLKFLYYYQESYLFFYYQYVHISWLPMKKIKAQIGGYTFYSGYFYKIFLLG